MTLRAAWQAARARRWLRLCARVGAAPQLAGKPTIYVEEGHQFGRVHVGDRFRLASRPVVSHLAVGPGAVIEIGNDVAIGCGAAIAAYERIQIGDGTRIGPFVIVMDTNFHGAGGDQSVQHDCRPVQIGAGCRIGSRVTITRGVTIGDGAEILAGSVVSSAVPAGACVAGARARIIGRAGDLAARWESAAAALPGILMDSLGLEAPPDLDGRALPAALWSDARTADLLTALHAHFAVSLRGANLAGIATFAELAAVVQHAVATAQRAR